MNTTKSPGTALYECMARENISVDELSIRTGLSSQTIVSILKDNRQIDLNISIKLASFFTEPPEFWRSLNIQKTAEIKKKQAFVIKVEGLIPASVDFRVMAEDEDEAYEIYENSPHLAKALNPPKILPGKIIKKRITIKSALSVFTNWVKSF